MRTENYGYDLLSRDGDFISDLSGVISGSITGNTNSSIKWTGTLEYVGDIPETDWNKYRVAPYLEINKKELERATKNLDFWGLLDGQNLVNAFASHNTEANLVSPVDAPPGHGVSYKIAVKEQKSKLYKDRHIPLYGGTYTFSLWVKSAAPVRFNLDLTFYEENVTYTTDVRMPIHRSLSQFLLKDSDSSSVWSQFVMTVQVSPNKQGASSVNIFSNSQLGGEMYVSELTVVDYNSAVDRKNKAQSSYTKIPLGVYVAVPQQMNKSTTGKKTSLDLYDLTYLLAVDSVDNHYSLPVGSLVSAEISGLIRSVAPNFTLYVSADKHIVSNTVWEPGTSKLKIINEILDSHGYFSLTCDMNGVYQVEQYTPPNSRVVQHKFDSHTESIHIDEVGYSLPSKVPNKVICVSQGSSDSPSMVAIAINQNPESPFSYQSQGMWVTRVETGVEAASQAILQSIADRYLMLGSKDSRTITRDLLTSSWKLNSVVQGESDRIEVITEVSINTSPGSLMKLTTKEVTG